MTQHIKGSETSFAWMFLLLPQSQPILLVVWEIKELTSRRQQVITSLSLLAFAQLVKLTFNWMESVSVNRENQNIKTWFLGRVETQVESFWWTVWLCDYPNWVIKPLIRSEERLANFQVTVENLRLRKRGLLGYW